LQRSLRSLAACVGTCTPVSGPRSLPRLRREPLLPERERGLLPVHLRVEDDVAPPQPVHEAESTLRVLELQIAAVVGMREQEGAVPGGVGVFDPDDGDAAHADALEQELLHGSPAVLVRHVADDEIVTAWLDADEIELAHEVLAEPAPDEGDVPVDLA